MTCNMKCILASIFGGFWSIWGPKLGWKIDQKSKQKSIEKTMEKSRRLGRVLGASWGVPRSATQCDAGADGVQVPPGAASIKEYQYTRHQYWITRHAAGQRPGEFCSLFIDFGSPLKYHWT